MQIGEPKAGRKGREKAMLSRIPRVDLTAALVGFSCFALAVASTSAAESGSAEDSCANGLRVRVGLTAEEACIKPGSGHSFKDCADCPEMVVVPAGSFMMGSTQAEVDALVQEVGKDTAQDFEHFKREMPQHRVTIAKPFAVGRFAITRGQFAAFVKATVHETDGGCNVWSETAWKDDKSASWQSPGFEQGDDHPAVCVNRGDATAYAAWLSKTTGQAYRLLSEAEFEYATRAGTATPFWWGPSISTAQANYDGDFTYAGGAKGEYRRSTVPVKSFQPNPWGLYQVHGNVSSWVEDCWNDTYANAPSDGSARTSENCSRGVHRGGNWNNYPWALRAASRGWDYPDDRIVIIGFRLARTLLQR